MGDDIIDGMIRLMLEFNARAMTPDQVDEFRMLLRREWGGVETYVRKEPSNPKTRSLAGSLAAGVGISEAFEAAAVSRRHGFRLLARRWRR